MIISLVILIMVYSQVGAYSGCPSPKDMFPCKCKTWNDRPTVTCKGSLSVIKQGLGVMSKYWLEVYKVSLYSDELKVLEQGAFGNADLDILYLQTPNLFAFDPDCFRSFERDFRQLHISSSSIKRLEDVLPALKNVHKLNHLAIQSSKLEVISDDHFAADSFKAKYLGVLDFSYNAIHTVEAKAFAPLKGLQYLYLYGNKINNFYPTAIPFPNQLVDIYLSYNKFTNVSLGLITRINEGISLYLNNNNIATVSLEVLRNAVKGKIFLHLNGNNINCDRNFKFLALLNKAKISYNLYGTCAEPTNLKGIKFNKLNVTHFD